MKFYFLCILVVLSAGLANAQKRPAGGTRKPAGVSKPQTATRQGGGAGDRKTNISNSGNKTNNIGSNNNQDSAIT